MSATSDSFPLIMSHILIIDLLAKITSGKTINNIISFLFSLPTLQVFDFELSTEDMTLLDNIHKETPYCIAEAQGWPGQN